MKNYICTSKFLAFTVGKVYEMTSRGLVDDDGDPRSQITENCRIIRAFFKEVPASLENK